MSDTHTCSMGHCEHCWRALTAERDALQAKVDAIDALHQPTPYAHLTVCGQCDANWPCPTAHILHPEGDTPT